MIHVGDPLPPVGVMPRWWDYEQAKQDYETLGGFVLSELGHLPRPKESFVHDGVRYQVTEASDRRVISVRVVRGTG